jgi:hypothetical protein
MHSNAIIVNVGTLASVPYGMGRATEVLASGRSARSSREAGTTSARSAEEAAYRAKGAQS